MVPLWTKALQLPHPAVRTSFVGVLPACTTSQPRRRWTSVSSLGVRSNKPEQQVNRIHEGTEGQVRATGDGVSREPVAQAGVRPHTDQLPI